MLFVNFSTELDAFKSKYNDVATLYKGDGIGFLLGDVDASEEAFQVSLCFQQSMIKEKGMTLNVTFNIFVWIAVLWTEARTGACGHNCRQSGWSQVP